MVDFHVGWIMGGLLKNNGREMAKSAISGQNSQKGTSTQSWYRYPLCRKDVVPVRKIWVPIPIDIDSEC